MSREPVDICGIFLLRDDNALLLQHRDNLPHLARPNMWTAPGGHLEPGETPRACAIREFFEETGYRCEEIEPLAVSDDPVEGKMYRFHSFWGAYDDSQPYVCKEGQALEFVRLDNLGEREIPEIILMLWKLSIKRKENSQPLFI